MGMWSSLFGTESIIEKGTDALISAGDKLVYTNEEKADMHLKLKEFHLKILKASEPFKVAQRLLAVWFSLLFGVTFLVGLFATVVNMVIEYKQITAGVDRSDIVFVNLAPLFDLIITFNLTYIMAIILAWYFTGGVLNSWKGK